MTRMTVLEALSTAALGVGGAWLALVKVSGHPGPPWWVVAGTFVLAYAVLRETMVRQ